MAAEEGLRQWIPLQKQLVPKVKGAASQYQINARRRHREAIESALRKGYLKILDEELILESQRESEREQAADELQCVLRISLNGRHIQAIDDIAILLCARLRICNLSACYVADISPFYGCMNLLKLDVSDNQIERVPEHDFWASLSSLRVLYLSGNAICGRESLSRLNACPTLHVLTLHNTPLSLMKNYRHHVVNSILSLRALDQYVISDEEIIENLRLDGPFRPFTASFRLQLYQPARGKTYQEDLHGVYALLLGVDRVLARHSPVVIIQRWTRGWLARRTLARSASSKIRSLVQRRTGGGQTVPPPPYAPLASTTRVVHLHVGPASTPPPSSSLHTHTRRTRRRVRKSQSEITAILPPPPPTSPSLSPRTMKVGVSPLSVETHVLGMEAGSSRMRYSMHINLHKLQQNVTDAEQSEPDGVNKSFKSAFQRKTPSKSSPRAKFSPQKKSRSERTSPRSQLSATEPDTPAVPVWVAVGPELPTVAEDKRKKAKPSPRGVAAKAGAESTEIEVVGQVLDALTQDRVAEMIASRKEDGEMIRSAEKDIKESVARTKQPPPKSESSKQSFKAMSKNEMAFTQAYATMTLSALRAVEKAYEARKKADALIRKANQVAKIKQERLERREKIEEFHRTLRENATLWKESEESRLERLRDKKQAGRSEELLQKSQSHRATTVSMQKQTEDKQFAYKFNQQSTLVGAKLAVEDRKMSQGTKFQEIKERVQQTREVSQEHQEMVRRFMELRETKLLREGASAKKELDAKLLQAASQHLMEVKQKVAKEVARKQAAKAAIAQAKEELRRAERVFQQPQIPVTVKMDLASKELKPHECELLRQAIRKQRQYTSPSYLKRMSRESHRTWQRGNQVLTAEGTVGTASRHFPLLSQCDETPLMYDMMPPGPMLRSLTQTPANTESVTTLGSSAEGTGGAMLQEQLAVR